MTKFTKQHHGKMPDHHSRIFVHQEDKEAEDINEYEDSPHVRWYKFSRIPPVRQLKPR